MNADSPALKQRKGFAVMKPHIVKRIAAMGGAALCAKRGSRYMSKIGRAGGKK